MSGSIWKLREFLIMCAKWNAWGFDEEREFSSCRISLRLISVLVGFLFSTAFRLTHCLKWNLRLLEIDWNICERKGCSLYVYSNRIISRSDAEIYSDEFLPPGKSFHLDVYTELVGEIRYKRQRTLLYIELLWKKDNIVFILNVFVKAF